MKKNRSLFILVVAFVMFVSFNSLCLADEDEKQISGNYGLDFYGFAAVNSGLMNIDHVYISGNIYRWDIRAIPGWTAAYLSDEMDIFITSGVSTITCYYRSDGHCCTAVFLGDAVK